MKTALREMVSATSVAEIPFQSASVDIWEKKYRLVAKDGLVIDQAMDETYKRVARALADVEDKDDREAWTAYPRRRAHVVLRRPNAIRD